MDPDRINELADRLLNRGGAKLTLAEELEVGKVLRYAAIAVERDRREDREARRMFAAHAMGAVIANTETTTWEHAELARAAWRIADDMMSAEIPKGKANP
jgi:hypothetical protein